MELSTMQPLTHPLLGPDSVYHANNEEVAADRMDATSQYPSRAGVVKQDVARKPNKLALWRRKHKMQGWRFGVGLAAFTCCLVLLLNLSFITIGTIRSRDSALGGVATLYEGDCRTVDAWSTYLHVLINVLSAVLLAASSYTLQCLSAPTRKEIDLAHARGDWVDIGILSVHNIAGRISWKRIAIWFILAVSSIPIHLVYNSVVFKTNSTNWYTGAITRTPSLRQNPYNRLTAVGADLFWDYRQLQVLFNSSTIHDSSIVQNLTNAQCIETYGTRFTQDRSYVLAITSQGPANLSSYPFFLTAAFTGFGGAEPFWVCSNAMSCDVSSMVQHSSDWQPFGYKIDYCLSILQPTSCKLQSSMHILAVVVAMNLLKVLCMCWALFGVKDPTLVTLGDAIASFLDRPDELTTLRCLMTKKDMSKGRLRWRYEGTNTPNTRPLPSILSTSVRRRWFAAASMRRWLTFSGMTLATLGAAGTLLAISIHGIDTFLYSRVNILSLGFGKLNVNAIMGASPGDINRATLIANSPQLLCSLLYVVFNGLWTSMLTASEWSRYYLRAKPLRVTNPRGMQRSTYHLQLPYLYSVPLIGCSGLLHWLISESIFVIRVDLQFQHLVTYPGTNEIVSSGYSIPPATEIGYSIMPIVVVVSLGFALLVAVILSGTRRFASIMPVVGSCSVAISAACHPPQGDRDAASHAVSWGEVVQNDPSNISHATFTSLEVRRLTIGRMYAGKSEDSL